jgi:hypothetical protein
MPGIPGATPVPSLPTPPNENGDSLMAYSTQTTTPIGDNGSGPDTQRNVGDPPGLNPPPLSNGGGGGTGTTFAPGPTIEDPVTTPDPTPNPNGVPSWWGKEQGYEYLTGKEHLWGMYQRDAAEMAKRGHTNVDFVDWLASMGLVSPKAGRAGYDTFRNFAPGVPDNGGAPGNSAGAPPTPTAVDPRTYLDANDPRLQPQTAGGGSTSTSTTTAGNGGAGGDTGYAGILSQLQQLMNPQFNFESDQLNRHMNAQAALTGDFASGGYGEVNGRANAQLAADQGNRVSGMLNTDWQNELDRILKQYGIDIGSADSRYGADAGVKAAGIGAGASRYATDQRNNEANNSYNLGLAGLGLDKYKFDNPDINRLLGYYMQMSPEQLAQFATGTPNFFPTFGYNQHP